MWIKFKNMESIARNSERYEEIVVWRNLQD